MDKTACGSSGSQPGVPWSSWQGKGLFATRKIKEGQVIIDEYPLLTVREEMNFPKFKDQKPGDPCEFDPDTIKQEALKSAKLYGDYYVHLFNRYTYF